MDRASNEERLCQCLTCRYTEICNLDEDSEDERGLCKEYRADEGIVRALINIKESEEGLC